MNDITQKETLTDQEIFDAVWQHAVVENKPRGLRKVNGNVCAYRNFSDGSRCLAGLLMTDEEARRADNDEDTVIGRNRRGLLPRRLVKHIELLNSLQQVHDHYWSHDTPPERRAATLREVADRCNLVVPPTSYGDPS